MNNLDQPQQRKPFEYKWVIVGLCFLMIFTCLGFCSSNSSLYTYAITEALDISRTAFSFVNSIRFISTSLINIFFGSLIMRFGTKKLICAGFVCLIAAILIYSAASNVFLFYIGGAFLGIGFSWTTTTMVGCVVNKWCKENKGTIMGAILAANGLGGALAAQIVSPIIYNESNPFGYRNAYLLVASILAVVGIIIVVFMKEQPKNYDKSQLVVSKKKSRGTSWVGIEFSRAKKLPFFYAAAVCIFLTGVVLQGINGVAAVHMKDVGLDPEYIATILSIHSITLSVFKFFTGFLYDRFGLRVTMNICSIAAICSMLSLAVLSASFSGKILAMFWSVVSSMALPLETIMLPLYAGDLVGQKSFDKVMGIFVSVNVAGYALGGPVTNLVFDLTGSYSPAIFFSAGLMLVIVCTMQFILNSAHRVRDEVIHEYELLPEKETSNV